MLLIEYNNEYKHFRFNFLLKNTISNIFPMLVSQAKNFIPGGVIDLLSYLLFYNYILNEILTKIFHDRLNVNRELYDDITNRIKKQLLMQSNSL